jgi:hypothetical protein
MSRFPPSVRHEDITVQVPTTLPPQGDTLEQDPVPAAPPAPLPGFPPAPDGLLDPELQAPEIIPNATAVARNADWTFIERLL